MSRATPDIPHLLTQLLTTLLLNTSFSVNRGHYMAWTKLKPIN